MSDILCRYLKLTDQAIKTLTAQSVKITGNSIINKGNSCTGTWM